MTRVVFSEGSRLRAQICISLVNRTWKFQLLHVEYEHAYGHSLCVFQASQNSNHHISTDGRALPQPHKSQQTTHNFSIRYDEGLTLETSSFEIFHGGNSKFINSFDETKFSCFTIPSKQHISCVRNENFV